MVKKNRGDKTHHEDPIDTRREVSKEENTPGEPADLGLVKPGIDKDHVLPEDNQTELEIDVENESVEDIRDMVAGYTDDPDIAEDFAERQELNTGGKAMMDSMREYTDLSPEISGGDVDAAWMDADAAGDEAVGGSTNTPDQDVVDELGRAIGVTYEEEEPLHDKLHERDENRWELDPRSATGSDNDERANAKDDEDIDDAEQG